METTIPNGLVWLIFLLPLISFALIALVIKPFLGSRPRLSGYITIGAITGSLILSLWLLTSLLNTPSHELSVPGFNWLIIEGSINIHFGLTIDMLTAVMLIVITIVSLMVQIYSQGYMHGDPGYHRYYVYMSLFTTAMLGLVMANNLLIMYVFWELVGLCSYLLIGFWFHRPAAAKAAKKAFIITRIGDFGFLAAILLLFSQTGTLDVSQLHAYAPTIGGAVLTWAAIGIFLGAAGKSAQFPLHSWLPDAMEGPTPVSALIHAATMVAAGVFLVARMYPLFEYSPETLSTVAVIGGFTAIFAATMGLVMTDIKRVLAYSTISQLGYMMLGLGVGGVAIGIFHLFNHAFFKALLFLGAGSVNHATRTFDMRLMGGLRKVMPWTYATFLIASLSIAGIWPLAGFWSKDEILASALANNTLLFYLAMITVFMTSFYMFRVVFMTFGGKYRGSVKPHESPPVMVVPMVILAILAVVSGWFNATGGFSHLLGHGESHSFVQGFFGILAHPLPWISLMMTGGGILLAYAIYSAKWLSAKRIKWIFRSLYVLFSKKYWIDELYEDFIGQRLLSNNLFAGMKLLDSKVIDGTVDGVARTVAITGKAVRRIQDGQLQLYGLFIILGVLAIVISLLLSG
ncbi:NADH-quinone oxidoreductase subunit L [Chloroflexota bacterium]